MFFYTTTGEGTSQSDEVGGVHFNLLPLLILQSIDFKEAASEITKKMNNTYEAYLKNERVQPNDIEVWLGVFQKEVSNAKSINIEQIERSFQNFIYIVHCRKIVCFHKRGWVTVKPEPTGNTNWFKLENAVNSLHTNVT